MDIYQQIIQHWLEANPLIAHRLGFHQYDGILPDMSKKAIEKQIQGMKEDLDKLQKIPLPNSKIAIYNHQLIENALQKGIFYLEERKDYEKSPSTYIFPLAAIETSYTAKKFDTVDNRVKHIISIQKEVPRFIDQALENLETNLAHPKILMAISFGKGIKTYWQDKLIEFISQASSEMLLEEWSLANEQAIYALDLYLATLENDFLPKSHNNFALGKEQFLTMLKYQEGVELSAEKLLDIGMRDLERNFKSLEKLGKKMGGMEQFLDKMLLNQPDPNNLLDEVRLGLDRIRDYLVESEFCDLPTKKQCEVTFTPEFMRAFASGAMNTPGPFEKGEANQAYYWVTPPDPNLVGDELTAYMKFYSYSMLEILTIHEVWPGHYLQLLFNNKSDNDIAKIFARSTSMIEGWAHYGEETIINLGYSAAGYIDRNMIHAAQLLKALMRNVRYISAIKMHCYGMTVEESKKLFMEKGLMTPIKSQLEANRGTIDPMYLNYTLGKLMIFKLRDDYKKEVEAAGKEFSLKKFHTEMLSYGSPPIVVLRKLMLNNPGDSTDVL